MALLRFTGSDAAAFLQGQVSNDTQRLAAGSALLSAYSSAQGRVLAVMTLLPHSTGIVAILPVSLVSPIAARLRKFILRSKVAIEEAPADLVAAGVLGSGPSAAAGLPLPQQIGAYVETGGTGIARLRDPHPRHWIVGPAATLDALGIVVAADATPTWRLADVQAGLPQVYAENGEEFVAQMLNLDLLDGISFSKGCYTGQEIIARTQHRGRIKRRMFRVAIAGDTAAPPIPGALVRLADGRGGRIVEVARSGAGFEALVVLPLEAVTDSGAGIPAALLSLPYDVT